VVLTLRLTVTMFSIPLGETEHLAKLEGTSDGQAIILHAHGQNELFVAKWIQLTTDLAVSFGKQVSTAVSRP
jgi:hypothetical protein